MSNLFTSAGTATRSQYWGTLIATIVVSWVLGFLCGMLIASPLAAIGYVVLFAMIAASTFVTVAVIIKRCRDAGVSAWWTLAGFIPVIGTIVVIVLGCLSTKADDAIQTV